MESPTNNPRAVRAEQSSYDGNPLNVIHGRDQEIGPFLAIFIILILLIAGAIYFWKEESGKNSTNAATTTEVIIYEHSRPAATSSPATVSSTSSTGNPELDAIRDSMESQTGSVNNLNF